MDGDILFWLGLLGIYLLRFLRRKKKSGSTIGKPQAEQPGTKAPVPGQKDRGSVPTPSSTPVQHRTRAQESEFDVALREIKDALGMGSSRSADPHPPPPEVFGSSEESFEQQAAYSETSDLSEERFERRKAGSLSAWKTEENFENKPLYWEAETTHDTAFDQQPAYSEVDFHDRYRDKADSPYEFHSQRKRKPEVVKRPSAKKSVWKEGSDSMPAQSVKSLSIRSRLKGRTSLREAAVLAEILGPPVSRKKK